MSEENVERVRVDAIHGEAERIDLEDLRRAYEAFGRRDWDEASSLADPEIEWVDPDQMAGGGTHRGKEAVQRNFDETFEENFSEFRLEPTEFLPSGDKLFVHALLSGRSRHQDLDVSMDLFQVLTIRNGLIIRQEGFLARDEALRAAGLRE